MCVFIFSLNFSDGRGLSIVLNSAKKLRTFANQLCFSFFFSIFYTFNFLYIDFCQPIFQQAMGGSGQSLCMIWFYFQLIGFFLKIICFPAVSTIKLGVRNWQVHLRDILNTNAPRPIQNCPLSFWKNYHMYIVFSFFSLTISNGQSAVVLCAEVIFPVPLINKSP